MSWKSLLVTLICCVSFGRVFGSNSSNTNDSSSSADNEMTGGYFDLELAPRSVASVPYADGHIAVWSHLKNDNRFFIRPLAMLLEETARCRSNNLTSRYETVFDVLMMSSEIKTHVANYLYNMGIAKSNKDPEQTRG